MYQGFPNQVYFRAVNVVDGEGVPCDKAVLCPGCPRRLGEKTVRAAGVAGWFGAKTVISVPEADLATGEIIGYRSNGQVGELVGPDGTSTGPVSFLNGEVVDSVVKDVSRCTGPDKNGDCDALGPISNEAHSHLVADLSAANPVVGQPVRVVIPWAPAH